ncbi:4-alpha-glucanotransferase [candidate division WOR-1 bacterium RIFOXYA12_FULL_52_29]|uniref:4-alpha-glucanotransferase n=1 Tax=candidate division WOR-1 bacterium RIFOXYC12_FULL_54_18 TaxID=1802584 RepID=A0A1F4T7N4_UNCSA|nr:MAG: 4-alpha-glucanotransferase [candidate division WOR-1 bacterium RIFOXYA2_FULL_51_19]OGC17686.1 MAG: 4-alpha-glucanotransferase [candidate division WOR-1 bacterium RIFOXYA12_FULL_52_29]OGC26543.1 MAG: 4-alpha-glucanotransferase [candidate division WOR-1 bacterium RIFOXYB2_FULL_45_9]OGC28103.1 MAG: 4-alpha-glucanotransferase [candidate division WOR-1 bacterium RIFOXYC12_FULL_54_18]OGC29611.1 MAG: 4-alpha-glucanotransferase [candidate division WOR-1 bacterium RIFOXYB12_FULL_52_16]
MPKRESGILLHITSLPSAYGIGDLGPSAREFVDFLAEGKQRCWQVLPLNPTNAACGNSPYSSFSSYAANPYLISPGLLLRDGLITREDIVPFPRHADDKVDFEAVRAYKDRIFGLAFVRFKNNRDQGGYDIFCAGNKPWLDDYALFVVLKNHFHGKMWNSWPRELRDRDHQALAEARVKFHDAIELEKFQQYLFFTQWDELKKYSAEKGVKIFGDIPIYVSFDSADVWTNPRFFKLDADKNPTFVAGVPPDYFSQTGQRWGNPVYDWDELKRTGYKWWIDRLAHNLKLFDLIRIDHFRGLVGFWQIPAEEETAINGSWVGVPADDFFARLTDHFKPFPFIAEDLGIITPDVREVMRRYHLWGMKVLLFAFGEENSHHPYLPHNYSPECVVYTGTHDNNTARGWFEHEARHDEKERLARYLGKGVHGSDVGWELIRLALESVASLAIFPMQDILGLGEKARMNKPGTPKGNWSWRMTPHQITPQLALKLWKLTDEYGR